MATVYCELSPKLRIWIKIVGTNKFIRKAENLKYDTKRNINRTLQNAWTGLGKIGLNFLNIIPELGKVVYNFFGDLFTNIFNAIYNQQIDPKKARNVIIGFFIIIRTFMENSRTKI